MRVGTLRDSVLMTFLDRCVQLLNSFPKHPVLGMGDVMLDQYRRGVAKGLSPEAPAIDLLNPDLTETPGGAANVSWNIGHLGGLVKMIGVVGADLEGKSLRALLEQTPGVSPEFIEDPSRRTTLKLRFYHQQFQVLRVSHETKAPLRAEADARVREALRRYWNGAGALFVEDYGKRLVNSSLVQALRSLRETNPDLPVILDPKIGNHHVYQPGMCTLLKPNWQEACQLIGEDPAQADHDRVVRMLSDQYQCDVLLTLGAEGALVFERSRGRSVHIPTRPREAFDIAGAGDTVLAVLTLALASGASLLEAALLANLAAGVVVEKSGTAFVTPAELTAELKHPKTQEMLAQSAELSAPRVAERPARS